jgi:hypothetical protein
LHELLIGAIAHWLRVYDFQDAMERVEMWKEWIEGEEHAEQYEFPDVDGCIPRAMRQEPLKAEDFLDLMHGVKDDGVRHLAEAAISLDQISRRLNCPEMREESREALMDCNPPLPALLVSFKSQDAIVGCFEDSQIMLEAEPEPSFLAEISPAEVHSVRQAFDWLAALCVTLAAASRLMALLPGNEEMEVSR